MTEPRVSYETVASTPNGPIVAVVFGGSYPPGSAGNEFALAMLRFLRAVIVETSPAGVVLDLVGLDYRWGDAIGSLALALLADGKNVTPSVILATGPTADALQPLLQPSFAFGVVGTTLFAGRPEAVAHLGRVIALTPFSMRWRELELLLRRLAAVTLRKPKHERSSVESIVDGLVSRRVLPGSFRSRIHAIATARDELLHGRSVPVDGQVRPILDELDHLLGMVRDSGNRSQVDGRD